MGFDWLTLVGWVVTLVSGLVPPVVHRIADRFWNSWFGKLFRARGPPAPPAQVRVMNEVVLTDVQLRQIVAAVQEGNRPLVEAMVALRADVDALRRDGLTFTATLHPRPPPLVDPG
jgi:hypothetical protein